MFFFSGIFLKKNCTILYVFFQVDSDNDSPDYKEQFIESGIFEEEEMDLKMEVEKELEMKRMIITKIANNNDNGNHDENHGGGEGARDEEDGEQDKRADSLRGGHANLGGVYHPLRRGHPHHNDFFLAIIIMILLLLILILLILTMVRWTSRSLS